VLTEVASVAFAAIYEDGAQVPVVHMRRLMEAREIASYVWCHPTIIGLWL
jgi:hypothetical protein